MVEVIEETSLLLLDYLDHLDILAHLYSRAGVNTMFLYSTTP